MTVQEFLRAYFGLGSKFQHIIVQRNDGHGRLEKLYSSPDGYCEQYMNPEVRNAVISKWGIGVKPVYQIWITVK